MKRYGTRGRRKRKRFSAIAALMLFLAGAFYVTGGFGYLPWISPFSRLPEEAGTFDARGLPEYTGSPDASVNGDVPFFSRSDLDTETFERYGETDDLGRCTAAYACIGPETMPEEERGEISSIYPTGWHNAYYEEIDRGYLYNRCHLIGYQLTGQNANERNLITGTRYMNVEGMLPYENSVAQYIRSTGNHVLYRVTPVFEGNNLVASGVLMEARSVEDPGVQFCVFCFNVQPGIEINYATGESRRA